MDNSNVNPTNTFKPLLAKNEGDESINNDFNYRSLIGLLNLLTNSTLSETQFAVHQCAQSSTNTKLRHDQAVKLILKKLQGTATQGLILKPDPENVIERYIDADFSGGWNQHKGTDPVLVLFRTGYVITYALPNHMGKPSITGNISQYYGGRYIALFQLMRYVVLFVSLMKDIELLFKLQHGTPKVMCSHFEKSVTVTEENQGEIALAIASQM